jgi:hypothetical protein
MFATLFYVGDAVGFAQYWPTLKQVACPRCRSIGFLNRHGFLWGYAMGSLGKEVRGWRLFCSNRRRRQGCGRTHSVLLSTVIYRHSIRTDSLHGFLAGVARDCSRASAWLTSVPRMGVENAYRLWRKFSQIHLNIRSQLTQQQGFPPVTKVEPCQQTWAGRRTYSADPIMQISCRSRVR